MRVRFLALSLVATATIACKDKAPTSSASDAPATAAAYRGPRTPSGAPIVTPPVGGFSSQVLSRGSFTDDIDVTFRLKFDRATTVVHVNDPSDVVMAKITLQPNSSLPWHTHHGPAIATVASGELTVVGEDGCTPRSYGAGMAFIDPGQGHVHIGFNATGVETVVYVTYLDVPAGQSPLVPTVNPGC